MNLKELEDKYNKLHTARAFFAITKNEDEDNEEEEIKLTTEEKVKFKSLVSEMHEEQRIKLRQQREQLIKGLEGTEDEIRRRKKDIEKHVKEVNQKMDDLHKSKLIEIDKL